MTDDTSTEGDTAGDRETPSVDPAALQRRIDVGDPVRVLDLRNRDEVEQWRLAGPAVSLTQKPYNRFVQATVTDDVDGFVADLEGDGPITVVCARGEASAEVASGLADAGHDARNLAGGMEAWARILLATEIEGAVPGGGAVPDGDASLVQYRRPSSGCLGYLVVSGDDAAVVDPLRAFADRYVADAHEHGAEVEYVVDTHVHADHVSGLRAVAEASDATAVMPAAAVERGVAYDVETVADGEELRVGDLSLEAVSAPGHTTGMTAFAIGDALLTGDSLFTDGVARPDLERTADAPEFARELYRTLTERFARFPDETVVAPGHHAEGARPDEEGAVRASLGECRDLPVFGMDEAAFVDHLTDRTPPRPANHERIVAINLGRESAADADAFELELGPNNCAAAPADD
ncbi:MBL fold metallo-hydrolase [Halosimplex salinum]|uniref:MBL fold metallo-hydrolase n=1 Tax=Halosimplex salinum TaxID=1710538 RepID=UPI000F496BA0|nr:MBL fold metallo-hydrolase [Halosimplex salinum]